MTDTPPNTAVLDGSPQVVLYPRKIIQAIAKVRAQIGVMMREYWNTHRQYSYASIDQYYERVPALCEAAGFRLQVDLTNHRFEMLDNERVQCSTVLVDIEWIRDGTVLKAYRKFDIAERFQGSQTAGIMLSYAKKQAYRQIFEIVTGEVDGDHDGPGPRDRRLPSQRPQQAALPTPSKWERKNERPRGKNETHDQETPFGQFEQDITKSLPGLLSVETVNDLYWRHRSTMDRMKTDDNARYCRLITRFAARKQELLQTGTTLTEADRPPSRPQQRDDEPPAWLEEVPPLPEVQAHPPVRQQAQPPHHQPEPLRRQAPPFKAAQQTSQAGLPARSPHG